MHGFREQPHDVIDITGSPVHEEATDNDRSPSPSPYQDVPILDLPNELNESQLSFSAHTNASSIAMSNERQSSTRHSSHSATNPTTSSSTQDISSEACTDILAPMFKDQVNKQQIYVVSQVAGGDVSTPVPLSSTTNVSYTGDEHTIQFKVL